MDEQGNVDAESVIRTRHDASPVCRIARGTNPLGYVGSGMNGETAFLDMKPIHYSVHWPWYSTHRNKRRVRVTDP